MSSAPTTTKPGTTTNTGGEEEGFLDKALRAGKNAVTQCFGCVQTTDERAKIKVLEYQREARKKAFGVAYLNLLNSAASIATTTTANDNAPALQQCVTGAQADVAAFDEQIRVLYAEIERVDGDTKSRLLPANAAAKPPPPATPPAAAEGPTAPSTAAATVAPVVAAPPVPAVPDTTTTTTTTEPTAATVATTNTNDVDLQEVKLDAV